MDTGGEKRDKGKAWKAKRDFPCLTLKLFVDSGLFFKHTFQLKWLTVAVIFMVLQCDWDSVKWKKPECKLYGAIYCELDTHTQREEGDAEIDSRNCGRAHKRTQYACFGLDTVGTSFKGTKGGRICCLLLCVPLQKLSKPVQQRIRNSIDL